jgi:hypothetical protein
MKGKASTFVILGAENGENSAETSTIGAERCLFRDVSSPNQTRHRADHDFFK